MHGDGGGPLAFDAANIGQTCTDHAHIVHATVLIEARIFYRQDGMGHDFGYIFNGSEVAAFFPKFTNQVTIC